MSDRKPQEDNEEQDQSDSASADSLGAADPHKVEKLAKLGHETDAVEGSE